MYLLAVLVFCASVGAYGRVPEDARLGFPKLAKKYGMKTYEHEVVTEDGYILKLFQISGEKTRPVLLVHGLANSADVFIIRGNKSLIAALAHEGYDVWVANLRGNKYSRRHQRLNPDVDMEFWNFTFHEWGVFDLPAIIDYVLDKTEQAQVSCIGYSLGNTVFYILGSMKPEYNNKVKVLIALSPVAYNYYWRAPALRRLLNVWPLVSDLLVILKQEELFGENTLTRRIVKLVCSQEDGYDRCVRGFMMPFNGWDEGEMEFEFVQVVWGHWPETIACKLMDHFVQLGSRNCFCQMDYGESRNLVVYNSSVPPDYDLSEVTMKVAMLMTPNDHLAPLRAVKHLRERLPNVVESIIVDFETANHIDLVWGRYNTKYVYPYIIEFLEKYKMNSM